MRYEIMRVYEFAKLHNISSKDLLNKLSSGGFSVASHMSILTEEEKRFLLDKNKLASFVTAKEKEGGKVPEVPQELSELEKSKKKKLVLLPMTVGELAEKIDKPVNEVILFFLRSGVVLTKNESV